MFFNSYLQYILNKHCTVHEFNEFRSPVWMCVEKTYKWQFLLIQNIINIHSPVTLLGNDSLCSYHCPLVINTHQPPSFPHLLPLPPHSIPSHLYNQSYLVSLLITALLNSIRLLDLCIHHLYETQVKMNRIDFLRNCEVEKIYCVVKLFAQCGRLPQGWFFFHHLLAPTPSYLIPG